jgi:GntR family transcriptional regulator
MTATTTNAGTGVTRYLQVYTVIAQALAEGSIGAGEALPSEPALVREYGVSRTTVRRALARLAAEGSIVRRRGSGTFARGKVERFASARQLAPILDDLRTLASNTTVRVLAFKNTATPDFLRREWPEFGDTVLMIRRVRYVKNEPVVLVTTYVPAEIGRQLTARRLGNDTVLVGLEKLGYRGSSGEQETSAVAADPLAARHLESGVGAPVLHVRRLVRDSKERIIEYSNYLYRPDRYEIHAVIERPRPKDGRTGRRP